MISKKKFLQIIKDLNLKNSQYDLLDSSYHIIS